MADLTFHVDVNMDGLIKKLNAMKLSNAEKAKLTKPAAEYVKKGIGDALLAKAKTSGGSGPIGKKQYPTRGIENELKTKAQKGGTNIVSPNDSLYYLKFVDEGHYVLDNRTHLGYDKHGNKLRNYRYRLSTLNTGNKWFGGYHFVDEGRLNTQDKAIEMVKEEVLKKIREQGG